MEQIVNLPFDAYTRGTIRLVLENEAQSAEIVSLQYGEPHLFLQIRWESTSIAGVMDVSNKLQFNEHGDVLSEDGIIRIPYLSGTLELHPQPIANQ